MLIPRIKINTLHLVRALLLVLGVVLLGYFFVGGGDEDVSREKQDALTLRADYGYSPVLFFEPNNFYDVVAKERSVAEYSGVRGLVIPHHLLASPMIANTLASIGVKKFDRIVLISPNHYEQGRYLVTTSQNSWESPAGIVDADRVFINGLVGHPSIGVDEQVLEEEHGVSSIMPFLSHYFPGTPVVPLALSMKLELPDIEKLTEAVVRQDTGSTLYIASVDFSHYLRKEEALERDRETRALLEAKDTEKLFTLTSQHMDSPRSIILLMSIMEGLGYSDMNIRDNKNSTDYLYDYSGEVTTYFSIVFTKPVQEG